MGVGGVKSALPTTFVNTFEEIFPFYLSIGMTYEQFWEQDCQLVKAYRKAEEMRRRRINQQSWLQGRYFYDALCAVAPIMNAFAKNGTTAQPYLDKPYPSDMEEKEMRDEEKMQERAELFRAYVQARNAAFRKRKEEGDK